MLTPAAEPDHYIGVDTGGTFTDAAVVAAADHRVVATAKALTTRGDLAIGVVDAIEQAVGRLPDGLDPARIGLVSVSTTLATNAVVEGHGDEIGVVLIGFDADMADRTGLRRSFPGLPIALVPGGHDHGGREQAPLDEAALLAAVGAFGDRPRAYAVSSTFSTRNPAHERRAAELVRMLTGRPVTCSSELASGLDAPRRALTAALNARLIGRVSGLVDAVERAMTELDLTCPLMLVKGDGSLALAETVAARPIETVLSGPAASLVGARWLSGLDDFLLSDMGGTTTDLGMVTDGRPKVGELGAEVGGWRTMVRAVDPLSIVLGVQIFYFMYNDRIALRPERVVPLALAATRSTSLVELLRADLADVRTGGASHGRYLVRPIGADATRTAGTLSDREAELFAGVGLDPRPVRELATSARATGVIEALRRRGLVQLVAFTPSDAAHLLGLQTTWSTEAAELGARLGARLLDMRQPSAERARSFAGEVWDLTVRESTRAVLETALGPEVGRSPLVDAICAGRTRVGAAEVSIRPAVALVAVGGPARVFYEEVGRRLGMPVVFPEHGAVANAVGAATGAIVRAVRVEVHGDELGYRVHGPNGVERCATAATAEALAVELAVGAARVAVEASGGVAPDVRTRTDERIVVPGRTDDGALISVVVTAEAVGRPSTSAVRPRP